MIPTEALQDQPAGADDPGGDLPYLPERDENLAQPLIQDGVPKRRLRQKTKPPAISKMSMLHIEGEKRIVKKYPESFEFPIIPREPEDQDQNASPVPSEDSWTLETEQSPREAPLPDDVEHGGEGLDHDVGVTKGLSFLEVGGYVGGGEKEGAPNNRAGGSRPMASFSTRSPHVMTKIQALETLHCNMADYVIEELGRVDGTSPEQTWNFPAINQVLLRKVEIEEQLHHLDEQVRDEAQKQLTNEFLVTKTIGNKEVRDHLEDWKESIVAEYEQLVVSKGAVKPMTKSDLRALAEKEGKDLEILPAKMVHTRKAGSGAYRSRAVVCGNYQSPNDDNTYAGGADGTQIRTALRIAAQRKWRLASTDIRTAFLNTPRRNDSRLVAMEVPYVFKLLGLAAEDEVWLIVLAMYGLQASPRDWCVHRDEVRSQL